MNCTSYLLCYVNESHSLGHNHFAHNRQLRPPFFHPNPPRQKRPSLQSHHFKTMNDKRDIAGNFLPDAKSLQPIPQKHHTHLFNLLHCIKFASAKEVYVYPLTQTETK